jgi:hypothetical protein
MRTARVIDGKVVAERLRAEVARRAAALPFRPGLRVVRVGDDPASGVYVRNKDRAAAAAGFDSETVHLPADTSEAALLAQVAALNADPAVDGILVQLPLPPQIRQDAVIAALDPAKDVDGFHPLNAGLLASGQPALVPCTRRIPARGTCPRSAAGRRSWWSRSGGRRWCAATGSATGRWWSTWASTAGPAAGWWATSPSPRRCRGPRRSRPCPAASGR